MPSTANPKLDDISDADTQEPIADQEKANATVVEVSDDDDAKLNTQDSADGKMRAIIERINAHSDRSDDDDDDPAANEDDVDFGNQIEDDPDKAPERKGNKGKGDDKGDIADDDDGVQDMQDGDDEEKDVEIVKPSKQTKGKVSRARASKDKEPKSKKQKKEGPGKVIRKNPDTKTKSKLVRSKASTAARKKDSAKTDDRMDDNEISPARSPAKSSKSSPKASPSTSPKTKKTAAKDDGKVAGKAEAKPRAKSTSKAPAATGKEAKPKKTIAKQTGLSRKPLLKKNEGKTGTVVRTYSKKGATTLARSSAAKKTSTANRSPKKKASKAVEKTPTKGRSKAKRIPNSSEEEEEEMEIISDAEDNNSEVESEDEETEETARTPVSKHAIIGSLACSSRDPTCTALLDHAVQQLGKYAVVYYGPDSNSKLSAYIIGKDTKRGWGILQALADGIPLVSDEWLSTSISEGKWKPMDLYRSDKFGQSPTSVASTSSVGHKIFDGQRVKVISHGKDLPSIRKLLRTCGARVAETRVDVVINDTEKAVDGHVNVTKKWLADSVEAGVVLDYDGYQFEN